MRTILILPLLVLLAAPAAADPCDDLWFTRNLVMDRAGYCFGSPLGRAVFDNADCTGRSVDLSRKDQDLVRQIQAEEESLGCRVDTSRTSLRVPGIEFRWRIVDLPVAGEGESGCIGWREAPTPLFAARNRGATVVAMIRDGDNLSYGHWPRDGWEFVTIHSTDWSRVKGAGWLHFKTDSGSCRQWAG